MLTLGGPAPGLPGRVHQQVAQRGHGFATGRLRRLPLAATRAKTSPPKVNTARDSQRSPTGPARMSDIASTLPLFALSRIMLSKID